jgi:hypothetical protein
MSNPLLEGLLGITQTKRSVFLSYHHDGDQHYYNEFSRTFETAYSCMTDNSLMRAFDSDDCEYVMRRIRENYITGSSCTVVLCGAQTRWRKYVDWEIKATLDKEHGLIGIQLPTNPATLLGGCHKPDRLQDNIDSGYAAWTGWGDLSRGPDYFRSLVEWSRSRPPVLIRNSRPLRARNGS